LQPRVEKWRDPQSGNWGVPGGGTATTHIIKPCIRGFDGLVENEHLCLEIAARLAMPAVCSSILMLDQPMKIGDRYDVERGTSMLTPVARALPDAVCAAHTPARRGGLSKRVIGALAEQLIANVGKRPGSKLRVPRDPYRRSGALRNQAGERLSRERQ
jgi:hypothetical protein